MRGLIPKFSAERMLREYVDKLYTPSPTRPARATTSTSAAAPL